MYDLVIILLSKIMIIHTTCEDSLLRLSQYVMDLHFNDSVYGIKIFHTCTIYLILILKTDNYINNL